MSGFPLSTNKMSFNLAYGDSLIKSLFSSVINVPASGTVLTVAGNNKNGLFFTAGTDLFSTNNSEKQIQLSVDFLIINLLLLYSITSTICLEQKILYINVFSFDGTVSKLSTVNTGKILSSSPIIVNNQNGTNLYAGTSDGFILAYNFNPVDPKLIVFAVSISYGPGTVKSNIVGSDLDIVLIENQLNSVIKDNNVGHTIPFPDKIKEIVLSKSKAGANVIIALSDNNLYILIDGHIVKTISHSGTISSFAVCDLKNDGENYIVYNSGSQIHAINLSGAEAVNFPFTDPDGKTFTGSPLCADFEGDKKSEVISFTNDGRIIALDGGTGKLCSRFSYISRIVY